MSLPRALGWGVVVLFITCSITHQSLWIDEAITWWITSPVHWSDFLKRFVDWRGSELQMPVAMIFSWAWARFAGLSEWQLRSQNLLWALLFLLAWWRLGRRFERPWLPLIPCLMPIIWFYMDEARPYIMQFALSSVILALTFIPKTSKAHGWWLAGVILALCGTSLLDVFILPSLAWLAWRLWPDFRSWRNFAQKNFPALLFLIMGLLVEAGWYLHTLLQGAGGSKLWALQITNTLFIIYEILGCNGLGPGRGALRELGREGSHGVLSLLLPYLPLLLVLVFFWLRILQGSFAMRKSSDSTTGDIDQRNGRNCLVAFLIGFLLLDLTCLVVGFPFWARHVIFLLPFFWLGISLTAVPRGEIPPKLKGSLLLLGIILLTSAICQVVLPQHKKDDNRLCAAWTLKLLNGHHTVGWVAQSLAGEYYGLPLRHDHSLQPQLFDVATMGKSGWPTPPEYLFVSKPDALGLTQAVSRYLQKYPYHAISHPQSFVVYHLDPQ